MPTYDYRCEANGRTVEVRHRMSDEVHTWGELCALADIDPGATDPSSPVNRLATGGNVITSGRVGTQMPPCGSSGGCAGGACGFNS